MDAKQFLIHKGISNNDFMDSGVADLIETLLTEYQALQLQQTGVSGCYIERICDSCNTGYFPELYRDSDGKQATVNFQDCPNCGKRDDIWVKVHADNNR